MFSLELYLKSSTGFAIIRSRHQELVKAKFGVDRCQIRAISDLIIAIGPSDRDRVQRNRFCQSRKIR